MPTKEDGVSTTLKPHCTRQHPDRTEVIIPASRLKILEAKERAHDDYLEAIRTIRGSASDTYVRASAYGMEYARAYESCLLDLSQAIVDAAARRMTA
jgi:hypothetical protein